MPESTYESLPETVLAYKKTHKIGRFDPAAPDIHERKVKDMWTEVEENSKPLFYFFLLETRSKGHVF